MSGPVLRWQNVNIGEVKERAFTWRDPIIWSERAPSVLAGEPRFREEFNDGEHTALELALGLVPDLEVIIDMARMKGKTVTVRAEVER